MSVYYDFLVLSILEDIEANTYIEIGDNKIRITITDLQS